MDGAMTKAPLGGETPVPIPTDRAKQGTKRSLICDGAGVPLGLAVDGANRNDHKLARATIEGVIVARPKPTPQAPQGLCLDKGYDYPETRLIAERTCAASSRARTGQRTSASSVAPMHSTARAFEGRGRSGRARRTRAGSSRRHVPPGCKRSAGDEARRRRTARRTAADRRVAQLRHQRLTNKQARTRKTERLNRASREACVPGPMGVPAGPRPRAKRPPRRTVTGVVRPTWAGCGSTFASSRGGLRRRVAIPHGSAVAGVPACPAREPSIQRPLGWAASPASDSSRSSSAPSWSSQSYMRPQSLEATVVSAAASAAADSVDAGHSQRPATRLLAERRDARNMRGAPGEVSL